MSATSSCSASLLRLRRPNCEPLPVPVRRRPCHWLPLGLVERLSCSSGGVLMVTSEGVLAVYGAGFGVTFGAYLLAITIGIAITAIRKI
ncbi:hypothetical protein D3C84_324700 [compost metagenome]